MVLYNGKAHSSNCAVVMTYIRPRGIRGQKNGLWGVFNSDRSQFKSRPLHKMKPRYHVIILCIPQRYIGGLGNCFKFYIDEVAEPLC